MPAAQTVAGVTASRDESPVKRVSGVTKSKGGLILSIYVQSSSAVIEYFQLFKNLTPSATPPFLVAVPADTAVPDMSYPIAIGGTLQIQIPGGDACPTSIVWCESTTQGTKTVAVTPQFTVSIQYR